MDRLSLVAPDLAGRVRAAGRGRARATALAGVRPVVARAGLEEDERVERALAALARGDAAAGLRAELEALADDLDERYWDLQEAREDGEVGEDEYLAAFARARAVTALCCALEDDAVSGALEALYEAHCAFADGAGVLEAAARALDAATSGS